MSRTHVQHIKSSHAKNGVGGAGGADTTTQVGGVGEGGGIADTTTQMFTDEPDGFTDVAASTVITSSPMKHRHTLQAVTTSLTGLRFFTREGARAIYVW